MLKRESAPRQSQSGAISLPVLGYPSGLTVAKPGDAAAGGGGGGAPKTTKSSSSSSQSPSSSSQQRHQQQLKSGGGGGTSGGENGHASLDEGNGNGGASPHHHANGNGEKKSNDNSGGAAEVDTRDSRTALGDDEGNLDYLSAEAFCQVSTVEGEREREHPPLWPHLAPPLTVAARHERCVRFDSIRLDSARCDSARLGSTRFGAIRFRSTTRTHDAMCCRGAPLRSAPLHASARSCCGATRGGSTT